jgi:septal ring factor EnvC (AmiA/AmiB activator)
MEEKKADGAKKATYCAFCGEEFPTDADGSAEAVTTHILKCPKHPIQEAMARAEKAEARVKELEGNLHAANTELAAARETSDKAVRTVGEMGTKIRKLDAALSQEVKLKNAAQTRAERAEKALEAEKEKREE